jgi:hypothetical protein
MGKRLPKARLITRGNLDGIVCAAVFLGRYPSGEITFISSPPSAAEAASNDGGHDVIIIADVPLTPEIMALLDKDPRIMLVDHHPACECHPQAVVDVSMSAAGALHRHFGLLSSLTGAVALADLYERSETAAVAWMAATMGRERIELESRILDFSWRYNIEDDGFRLETARALSAGSLPSEVGSVVDRYQAMIGGDRWARALSKVREKLQVRGGLGLLDLRRDRPSLYGFGSLALVEAARERGCRYAMLVHDSRDASVASLRACGGGNVDLGLFVRDFARAHGTDGGGHPGSAGVRLPRQAADRLIDELAAAVG